MSAIWSDDNGYTMKIEACMYIQYLHWALWCSFEQRFA
jgi:hypothetical protein